MLEVLNLTKAYLTPQQPLVVLDSVSFSLRPGDAASIMGPSGSGKSTLLYIIGALDPPSSGTVVLNGQNPYSLAGKDLALFRNRYTGFVFQDHCLLPQCSVLENVLVPTLVAPRNESVDGRARTLLDQVGLSGRLDHRPSQLSGGEKQRVAIARALIREPELVLCDEPTGNLDRESAGKVADLLFELHERHKSILIVVTHSAQLAERFPIRFELAGKNLKRPE